MCQIVFLAFSNEYSDAEICSIYIQLVTMNGEQTAGKSWGRFKVSEDKGCGERHINKQIPPYLLSHPLCPSPCRYSEVTIDTILFWSFLTIRLKLFLATLSLTSKTGTWLPSSKSSLILFENWNTSPIPTRGKLAGASARGRGVQMPKGEKNILVRQVALHQGAYPFRDFGRFKKSFRLVTEVFGVL